MQLNNHFCGLLERINYDVVHETLDNLDLRDLNAFRLSSHQSDILVADYLTSKYHTLLALFVKDVATFRAVMRNTNSVVSGSAALAFVLPHHDGWKPNDLDLYTTHDDFVHIVAYLQVVGGYEETPSIDVINHYGTGVEQVTHLTHSETHRCIDVIRSSSSSALHPIAFFWLTAVMNFLSADHAYIAHPDLTLKLCALVHPLNLIDCNTPDDRTLPLMEKYKHRGFDIQLRNIAWSHHDLHAHRILRTRKGSCASTVRFVGDEFGIKASFHPGTSTVADVTQRQGSTLMWRRGGIPCGLGCIGRATDTVPFAENVTIPI